MQAVLVLAEQPALVYAQPLVPVDVVVDVVQVAEIIVVQDVLNNVLMDVPVAVVQGVQVLVLVVVVVHVVQDVPVLALLLVAAIVVQTALVVVENVQQPALQVVVLDARAVVHKVVQEVLQNRQVVELLALGVHLLVAKVAEVTA